MAITIPQVQGAQATTLALMQEIQQLSGFLNQILLLANAGWQTSIVVGGVTKTQTLSAQDQTDILTAYNTLKAAMVTTFNQLP